MKLRAALATTTSVLLLAGAAHAASYNATTSFKGTGQGGAFQYGTSTGTFTDTGVFTAFGSTSADCAGDANFLCASNGSLVPGVGKVIDGGEAAFQTVLVPSGTLWVHPGTDVQTEIVFTAPTAGEYSFTANVGRLDTTSNGNGVNYFFQRFSGGSLSASTPYGADSSNLGITQELIAGQQIAFAINNNGEYSYDSTAVDLSVTGPRRHLRRSRARHLGADVRWRGHAGRHAAVRPSP